jgi:hypothetical protein
MKNLETQRHNIIENSLRYSFMLLTVQRCAPILNESFADKGRWRCYNRGTVQKEARLVDVLQSLIDRKLSMEVFIDTVTQLGPSGAMGFTIDSYGSWTQLQPYDSAMANLALEVFLQDIKTRQIESHADIFSPSSQQQQQQQQPCVLEEDWYTLCDYKVRIM